MLLDKKHHKLLELIEIPSADGQRRVLDDIELVRGKTTRGGAQTSASLR